MSLLLTIKDICSMISLNINSKVLIVYYEEFSLVGNYQTCNGCFFNHYCGRIVNELNTFNDGGCYNGMIYKFIGSESRAKIIVTGKQIGRAHV